MWVDRWFDPQEHFSARYYHHFDDLVVRFHPARGKGWTGTPVSLTTKSRNCGTLEKNVEKTENSRGTRLKFYFNAFKPS